MICKSYDQLTIVEKTQFIGKLMHLIQTNEYAFLTADQLIKKADAEGLLDKVTILPAKEAEPAYELNQPLLPGESSYQSRPMMYIPAASHNLVATVYSRTKDSIHRSYQKLFTRLAS